MHVPPRLVWKCRRGMREMDILLERFVERGYEQLDVGGRDAFERLLDLPDQDILGWLWGTETPADPALAALIDHMRSVVQTQ
jgi:antitoxin CptB